MDEARGRGTGTYFSRASCVALRAVGALLGGAQTRRTSGCLAGFQWRASDQGANVSCSGGHPFLCSLFRAHRFASVLVHSTLEWSSRNPPPRHLPSLPPFLPPSSSGQVFRSGPFFFSWAPGPAGLRIVSAPTPFPREQSVRALSGPSSPLGVSSRRRRPPPFQALAEAQAVRFGARIPVPRRRHFFSLRTARPTQSDSTKIL